MNETRHECEVECRKALIQKFCGCSPITLQKCTTEVVTEKVQECTFAQYENCLNYSGKEDEKCRTKCLDNCEYWQYDIGVPSINPGDCEVVYAEETCEDGTTISISILRYDFLIFQESYEWTLSDFIASFSGALGLCFGINIVDVIRFVSNVLLIITGKLRTVLKMNTADERTENVDQGNAVNLLKKILAFFNIEGLTHGNWLSVIKWLIKTFFWAVIYAAGGIFTATFCKNLIEQYQSNVKYTSLTINYNMTYSLPPATLCVRIPKQFLVRNQYPNDPYHGFDNSSLKGYFNSTDVTKEEFLQQNNGSTWPLGMTYTVYVYLSFLYTAETSSSSVDFAVDYNGLLFLHTTCI
jgi:hypothetical protein